MGGGGGGVKRGVVGAGDDRRAWFQFPFLFPVCSTFAPSPTRVVSILFLMFPVFPAAEYMAMMRTLRPYGLTAGNPELCFSQIGIWLIQWELRTFRGFPAGRRIIGIARLHVVC